MRVVGAAGSREQLRRQWEEFLDESTSLARFEAALPAFVDRLAALPRINDPRICPRVVVTGDFFTRFSPFFMEGVIERYARRGIILKPVDLSHWLLYLAHQSITDSALRWGMQPGLLAFGKACTRVFHPDGQGYLQNWLAYQAESRAEKSYRGLFRKTGLLVAEAGDVPAVVRQATVAHFAHDLQRGDSGGRRGTTGRGQGLRRDHAGGSVQLSPLSDFGGDPEAVEYATRDAAVDLRE